MHHDKSKNVRGPVPRESLNRPSSSSASLPFLLPEEDFAAVAFLSKEPDVFDFLAGATTAGAESKAEEVSTTVSGTGAVRAFFELVGGSSAVVSGAVSASCLRFLSFFFFFFSIVGVVEVDADTEVEGDFPFEANMLSISEAGMGVEREK